MPTNITANRSYKMGVRKAFDRSGVNSRFAWNSVDVFAKIIPKASKDEAGKILGIDLALWWQQRPLWCHTLPEPLGRDNRVMHLPASYYHIQVSRLSFSLLMYLTVPNPISHLYSYSKLNCISGLNCMHGFRWNDCPHLESSFS